METASQTSYWLSRKGRQQGIGIGLLVLFAGAFLLYLGMGPETEIRNSMLFAFGLGIVWIGAAVVLLCIAELIKPANILTVSDKGMEVYTKIAPVRSQIPTPLLELLQPPTWASKFFLDWDMIKDIELAGQRLLLTLDLSKWNPALEPRQFTINVTDLNKKPQVIFDEVRTLRNQFCPTKSGPAEIK